MHLNIYTQLLIVVNSLIFIIALNYAFKLSKETKNEKYWLSLALATFFLALHPLTMLLWEFELIGETIRILIEQISLLIGGSLFLYSMKGLLDSMRKIRKSMK